MIASSIVWLYERIMDLIDLNEIMDLRFMGGDIYYEEDWGLRRIGASWALHRNVAWTSHLAAGRNGLIQKERNWRYMILVDIPRKQKA